MSVTTTLELNLLSARYFRNRQRFGPLRENVELGKGRLLLIGTVDLDSERPVVWNITKIAASHSADSLELVHKILRASAAIPGAFPPVMINVLVNGRNYTEMHVDGSVAAQVFVYWTGVLLNDLAVQNGGQRHRKVYILS